MITEDYVSFETAKLLKKKRFNGQYNMYYIEDGEYICSDLRDIRDYAKNIAHFDYLHSTKVPAPTLQMAMKWLREVHKMYVCIDIKCFMPHLGEIIDGYSARIWYKPKNNAGMCCYWVYPPKQQEAWDTYKEAAEAAIKYCLENLIE